MRYSDLLEAERNYLLYHGTGIDYLVGMLNDNTVRGDYGSDDFHMGVSLTTKQKVAWSFANNAEEGFHASVGYENVPFDSTGCLLVFNSSDLRANFGIKRVRDGDSSEMEMRTFGHIENLRDHLVAIIAHRDHVEFYKTMKDEAGNIAAPSGEFLAIVEWILASPLLREPDPAV